MFPLCQMIAELLGRIAVIPLFVVEENITLLEGIVEGICSEVMPEPYERNIVASCICVDMCACNTVSLP